MLEKQIKKTNSAKTKKILLQNSLTIVFQRLAGSCQKLSLLRCPNMRKENFRRVIKQSECRSREYLDSKKGGGSISFHKYRASHWLHCRDCAYIWYKRVYMNSLLSNDLFSIRKFNVFISGGSRNFKTGRRSPSAVKFLGSEDRFDAPSHIRYIFVVRIVLEIHIVNIV